MYAHLYSICFRFTLKQRKERKKKKNGKEKEIRTEVHTFKYFEKNLSRFFTLYLLIRLKKTYFASLRYYRHWINFRKKYIPQASKIILFLRVQPSLSYFISIQSQKNSFCPKNNFLSNLLLQKSNRQEFKKKKRKRITILRILDLCDSIGEATGEEVSVFTSHHRNIVHAAGQ